MKGKESRQRIVLLCVASTLVGALLSLASEYVERANSRRPQPVESTRLVRADSGTGAVRAPTGTPDDGSAHVSRPTGLQVVDARTGVGIAQANVVVAAAPLPGRAVVRDSQVSLSVTTDTDGRCRLAVPSRPDLRVFAYRRGFLPAQAAYDAATMTIELKRAAAISGVVIDRAGSRVPGATVVARSVAAPDDVANRGERPAPDAHWERTRTDAGGAFVLDAGSSLYVLEASGDGWMPARGQRGDEIVTARSGAVGVRLVVDRVAIVRLRFTDESTGAAIRSIATTLDVSRGPGVVPSSLLRPCRAVVNGAWRSSSATREVAAGVVEGVVRLKPEASPPSAVVRAAIPGYETVAAEIRLGAGDGIANEVRLRSTVGARAALVVRAAYASARTYHRKHEPVLYAISDRETTTHRGEALGHDTWRFEGLPARRLRVRLDDGRDLSGERETVVRVGADNRVDVAFASPTGFTLEATTLSGMVLGDVDAFVKFGGPFDTIVCAPETGRTIYDSAGKRVHAFQPVAPGSYRLIVTRPGFQSAALPLRVEAGAVTRIEAVLEPVGD